MTKAELQEQIDDLKRRVAVLEKQPRMPITFPQPPEVVLCTPPLGPTMTWRG